ncbi:DNA repair exonuclease SbcCD ATPase subunit [Streptomyces sp. SLBN-8D4]
MVAAVSRRKGVKTGAERDVEAVLDDLYTTPPADFVARREELAAAAKAADHVDDARRIHAARRPTLAAWAANLLLRSQPQESRQFLELGQALREAYRTLDAVGINELSEQRRRIVAALSGQAAQLAQEAGHRLSDQVRQDVESTLRAVLTDQDAADQWAGGRLEGALTPPSDFPGTAPPTGAAHKPRRETTPQPSARTRAKNELAERRRQREERLDHARTAAEEAAQRLRDARTEEAEAEAARQLARDGHDQARKLVSAAEQQLHQAQQELQRADREQREAEERSHTAADAHARARQEAREAEREVKRLTSRKR